ncbi:MAG: hypothetical protein AB1938_08235 [Myxococcota bacterium]
MSTPVRAFLAAFALGLVASACLSPITRGYEPDSGCTCASTPDCPTGFECVGCQCQPAVCTSHLSCAPGVCQSDGGCGACSAQTPCGAGQACGVDGGCGPCDATRPCPGGQVCGADGGCRGCTSGADCAAPLACALGACGPCTALGAECAANLVCLADGGCGACASGATCTTNPNRCFVGAAQCMGTSFTCLDTAVPSLPGVPCTNGVCDGDGGCSPCNAGEACTGNRGVCLKGVVSCAAGSAVCVDSTELEDAGHPCGVGQVCDPTGACVACVPGLSCDTNPGSCLWGVTACTGGTPRCIDTSLGKDAGTPCGTDAVCTAQGACLGCDAGNPAAQCIPNFTDSQPCGHCGRQQRVCTSACTWGPPGACMGETPEDLSSPILFLDPATPTPPGWRCISCGASDPFFRRFPRGAATAMGTGGSDTHDHLALVTFGDYTGAGDRDAILCGTDAVGRHALGSADAGIMAGSSLPPYRHLKIIEPMAPTRFLPPGVVVLLDTPDMPNGNFTRYTSQDGYFIRGEASAGTGGAMTHSHAVSGASGPASRGTYTGDCHGGNWGSICCAASSSTHTHDYSAMTPSAANIPPHSIVNLGEVIGPAPVDMPVGMIALFTSAPGPSWQVLSTTLVSNEFLLAGPTPDFDVTAGATTHSHGGVTGTTAGATGQTPPGTFGTADSEAVSINHTHSFSVSATSSSSHLPRYIDVIIAKRVVDGNACP